jgi:glyoxylase-like metal-dependent hydrolase (beta-lactamase superfamily II)
MSHFSTGARYARSGASLKTVTDNLRDELVEAMRRFDVPATPIVVDTPWDIGPVAAYLFPSDPVTLIDSAVDTPDGRAALTAALAEHGLDPADVTQVIVTHTHTDHFGGAIWLQQESGCTVFAHSADIDMATDVNWQDTERQLFPPLGFTPDEVERFFGGHTNEWRFPDFTPMEDNRLFATGESRLRIEHHAGHTPGHVWVIEEQTGAMFVGDYLIANHPTNAGMERDAGHATGRAQLLEAYNAGLRELARRDAPVVFAGHGPPMTDHRDVIARRLSKTDRRTRHVLEALRTHGPITPVALGRRMYRDRMDTNWEVVSDLVGRLDLLVSEGHARTRMGEDGAWYFTANEEEN